MLTACAIGRSEARMPVPVIEQSYDYIHPYDLNRPARPAYTAPVTNQGWLKGGQDPVTGQWVSGQYVATVVEPPHLTSQEEAEMSGRPYVLFGDSGVVPNPISDVPSSPQAGTEIDLDAMRRDLSDIRQRMAALTPTPDQVKALGSLQTVPPVRHATMEVDETPVATHTPSVQVPTVVATPAPAPVQAPPQAPVQAKIEVQAPEKSSIIVDTPQPSRKSAGKIEVVAPPVAPKIESEMVAAPTVTDLGGGSFRIEMPARLPGEHASLQTPDGKEAQIEFREGYTVRVTYDGVVLEKPYGSDQDRIVLTIRR